jgi:hypothetical protein
MSAGRVAALVITAVAIHVTTASGQGLGAAAARAAEARKTATSTQPPVKLTDKDLPKASVLEAELSSFSINTHVLHRYASARGCIASVRSLTPVVDEALLAAEEAEKDLLAIEGVMRDHADVLGCFERWRIEPREYTLAHMAFYRAIEDSTNLEAVGDRLSPIRKQNAKFLRELDDNGSYYFTEWTTRESALIEQRKRRK